jgi:ribosomal protein L28
MNIPAHITGSLTLSGKNMSHKINSPMVVTHKTIDVNITNSITHVINLCLVILYINQY